VKSKSTQRLPYRPVALNVEFSICIYFVLLLPSCSSNTAQFAFDFLKDLGTWPVREVLPYLSWLNVGKLPSVGGQTPQTTHASAQHMLWTNLFYSTRLLFHQNIYLLTIKLSRVKLINLELWFPLLHSLGELQLISVSGKSDYGNVIRLLFELILKRVID
jgi:hypothetical protein